VPNQDSPATTPPVLSVDPGLCGDCRHASVKATNRGTAYLRCTRAAWDERLPKYPRLPKLDCPGFTRADADDGQPIELLNSNSLGDTHLAFIDLLRSLVCLRTVCGHNVIREQRGGAGSVHIAKITRESALLFGANGVNLWEYVPTANASREHLYELNSAGKMVWPSCNGPIPAAWPTLPAGKVGFYTIYPNPTQLLAGELDTQLKAFIGSVPAQGGVLTAYAEADADYGKGGQFAPAGLTQDLLYQVHAHLHNLCKGTPVKYGAVFCGVTQQNVAFAIPGLDFYALDWYDSWTPVLFEGLNEWAENVAALQPYPVLAIAETNSNVEARRPFWFSSVYGWLRSYQVAHPDEVLGFWSYWNQAGPLSGPFLPNDTATIAALTSIGADAALTGSALV
jgi:hypothetical protein